jgi:RNA polymerase sigma-70 factor (ECF subfamily)
LEDYHDSIVSAKAGPELSFRRRQFKEHLKFATAKLSDKQRSAFVLRDVQGCKVDDVANIMDMPEATVRWYLHRARATVRRELLRRCPQLLVIMGIR